MCLAQQKLPQAAGAEEGGPLAAEDGGNRKERGKGMVEMVIALVAGFLGALVGGAVAGIAYQGKLINLELRLEEIKMTLEDLLRLEKKNLPPPSPLEESNVGRFAQNKLIHAWWIGGGPKKARKAEE
jgi:hypothetical protein